MLDWMTLTIEAVGLTIFIVWIVIPIREFRVIFKRLKHKEAAASGEALPPLTRGGQGGSTPPHDAN